MCRNQMRQLGLGFRLFQQDHNEMFPPAGYGTDFGQITWDSWIHRYIGGHASDADLVTGLTPTALCPKIELCPADKMPTLGSDPQWGWTTFGMRRSYAMNSVGTTWGTDYQVSTGNRTYPLPNLSAPSRHGIGIYWQDIGQLPDWDAKGYKASVIVDPAGTFLLVEEPNIQNLVGNIWPCICLGPQGTGDPYQIDPSPNAKNYGNNVYGLHGNRFNYLFHDGHVAALSINQTIGTGTLNAPKGMWTVRAGD